MWFDIGKKCYEKNRVSVFRGICCFIKKCNLFVPIFRKKRVYLFFRMLIGLDVIFCKRISICFLTLFFPIWTILNLDVSTTCGFLAIYFYLVSHNQRTQQKVPYQAGEIGLNNVLSVLGQPFRHNHVVPNVEQPGK